MISKAAVVCSHEMAKGGCGIQQTCPLQGCLHGQVAPQDHAHDWQRSHERQPQGAQPEPVRAGVASPFTRLTESLKTSSYWCCEVGRSHWLGDMVHCCALSTLRLISLMLLKDNDMDLTLAHSENETKQIAIMSEAKRLSLFWRMYSVVKFA